MPIKLVTLVHWIPLATGVLPICLGEATKFSQFLLDSDKHYLSTFTLGVTTDDRRQRRRAMVDRARRMPPVTLDSRSKAAIARLSWRDPSRSPRCTLPSSTTVSPCISWRGQGIEVEREARTIYTVFEFPDSRLSAQGQQALAGRPGPCQQRHLCAQSGGRSG